MVKTFTIKVEIPADRKLVIQLPDDFPPGPAEIVIVVVTPHTDVSASGGPPHA